MAHERIEVDLPLSKVYDLLSTPLDYPRWMEGIDNVIRNSSQSFDYETKIAEEEYKWTTNVIDDLRNTRFAWITINGKLNQTGTIRVTPLDNSTRTRVDVSIDYRPFFGKPADELAVFIEDASARLKRDLERFKEMAESDAFLEDPSKTKAEATA